jgi:uncharacterized protein with HEPN domain
MAGTRDRLIHDYFGVDDYIVYDVARNKGARLASAMEGVIGQEMLSPDSPGGGRP